MVLQRVSFGVESNFPLKISHPYGRPEEADELCCCGMGGKSSECVVFMKKEKYNSNCLLILLACSAEDIKTRGRVDGLAYHLRADGRCFIKKRPL
jgi:hypothetical protein